MGSAYQSQSASNYNASPPPDDGSTTSSNKITWAGIKSKLADSIKALADAINSQLRTALNVSPSTTSVNYTTVVGDHLTTIEVSGTTTISLGDAATMVAQSMGYATTVYNKGTAAVTVGLATNTNTLAGQTNGTVTLQPGQAMSFTVAQSGLGYDITGAIGFAAYVLTGAAGTNTATANAPANLIALYSGLQVWWTPANANTGATTLAITPSGGSALTAKNVFVHGTACAGGELKNGVPLLLEYDGTQFNVIGGGLDGFASQSANTVLAGPTSGAAAAAAFRALVGADGASAVLLATASASSSATVDFTSVITNTYDSYLVTLNGVAPATDAVNLLFRASNNNGSSYFSTNEYYSAGLGVDAATQTVGGRGGTALTSITLPNNVGNGANQVSNGYLVLKRGANTRSSIEYSFTVTQSGGSIAWVTGGGLITNNNGINAIRFLMSSGNIASGNFAIWGLRIT